MGEVEVAEEAGGAAALGDAAPLDIPPAHAPLYLPWETLSFHAVHKCPIDRNRNNAAQLSDDMRQDGLHPKVMS